MDDYTVNVIKTVDPSTEMGFVVHFAKSVFESIQILPSLGFILDSITMTVYLTPAKADKLASTCKDLLKQPAVFIREVAQLVRCMVGSFPGVEYDKLYYRFLDNEKAAALTQAKVILRPKWL